MIAKYKHLWRVAPIATALLSLSIVVLLIFTLRLGMFFFRPPPPKDVVIEPWMTPGFVAHSWHIPPDVMGAAMQIEPRKGGRPQNLEYIAEQKGIPVDQLIADIEAAIAEFRSKGDQEQ